MHTLFISDLHLTLERPAQVSVFNELMQGPARKADQIYILGDLFDAWAGDDDNTSPHETVLSIIRDCVNSGTRVSVMRGNRDYLMGKQFAQITGAELLHDYETIDLYGKKTLLMHGDLLCTRDWKYQWMRRLINNRIAIPIFMCLRIGERKKIWHGVRNLTQQSVNQKPPEIMDVDQQTVLDTMRRYQVFHLIHGHTHRPQIHEFSLDGKNAYRYVLGDWYEEDSLLVVDQNEFKPMSLQDYNKYLSNQSA